MGKGEELPTNSGPSVKGPTVMEIHIDFLLEEEFNANRAFLDSFVRACRPSSVPHSLIDVKHSFFGANGESDLVVRYHEPGTDGAAGQRIGILIEDKIGAQLQPEQAERYRVRGQAGKRTDWDDFVTCLVAPERYAREKRGFDEVITLETIRNWIGSVEEARREFKLRVIDDAIAKQAIDGPKIVDAAVTEFRRQYFNALQDFNTAHRSNLKMHKPGNSWKGEIWFRLKSDVLPKGVFIVHKSERGYVDLTFEATDIVAMQPLREFLEDGMTLDKISKSTAVRLHVPVIERYDNFASAASTAEEGFEAALRLVAFYVREVARIMPVLKSARTVAS